MDLFTAPGWGKKSASPTPPTSFQKELRAKMQERHRQGLSADISASERDSDEGLASDDDLISGFNMTNQSKNRSWKAPSFGNDRTSPASNRSKSPYDGRGRSPAQDIIFGKKTPTEEYDEDDLEGPSSLMMTMKKPWNPTSLGAKTLPNPKARKNKTLNEDDSPRQKKDKPWTPPTFKRNDEEEKENRAQRPKSPNVRGRKTPTSLLDAIDEEQRPTPSPRPRKGSAEDFMTRPKPKPRVQGNTRGFRDSLEDEDDDEMMLLSARQESPVDHRFDKARRTNFKEGGRKTPSDDRRSPENKVNIFGRKTPVEDRRTPSDGHRTPQQGRQTPTEGNKYVKGGRKTAGDGRKSPLDGRGTPKDNKFRKSPDEKDSPKVQKKTMMDMFSAASKPEPKTRGKQAAVDKRKKSLLQDSSSEDEGIGAPRRSPSPMMKGRKKTPTDDVDGFRMGPSLRNKYDRNASPLDDRDGLRGGPSLRNKQMRRTPTYDDEEQFGGRGNEPSLRNKNRASPGFHPQRGSPTFKNRNQSPYDAEEDYNKHSRHQRQQMDDEDDDEGEGHRSAFRPTPVRRNQRREDEQRGRPRSRGSPPERESSVCREVEKDPTMKKQQETIKEKKLAKSHTTQGRMLEDAIASVENAQDKTIRVIDPPKKGQGDAEENNELPTMKSNKHRPKPRYAKPVIETTPRMSETTSFNSTTDIRNAVYQEWYKERTEKAKILQKERKQKEKEEEEKKKKSEKDKIFEAKVSYQAWMDKKKDYVSESRDKKRKEEEKKFKKLDEEQTKLKEAEKTFKIWKEGKDVTIREDQRKKKGVEQEKREQDINLKHHKKKDSEKAFEGWKKRKDNVTKDKSKEQQRTTREKHEEDKKAQEDREEDAIKSYNKWMARKEKQQTRDRKRQTQRQIDEEDNPTPAWSPANRTIPFGR